MEPIAGWEDPADLLAFFRAVEIDEENLPQEWVDQPRFAARYAYRAAAARRSLHEAEFVTKLAYSRLYLELRADASRGGEKITEETLKHRIVTHETYQAAEAHRITCAQVSAEADAQAKNSEVRQYALHALSRRLFTPSTGS